MKNEDLIDLPASSDSGGKSENGDLHKFDCEPSDANSEPVSLEAKEDKLNEEMLGSSNVDVEIGESQPLLPTEMDRDLIGVSSLFQVSTELNETTAVAVDVSCPDSRIETENGCLTVQEGHRISGQKRVGSPLTTTGVKKAKITVEERQSSVNVMYNSLTRESKWKLEELLQHWSEWHAQYCSSSHNPDEVLESGELTIFPAIRVGLGNASAVSFWMDDQPRNKEFASLDSKSVPLYDRGYSLCLSSTDGPTNLDGGLEVDASRCFNCGSYSHALKECPKPRDNVAVNNARKQHKSRRNQNASSRNPTRYYQNSPRGKYDGLRPGVLDSETRQLLGLGEFDPPPWLNRMREIGYPPGYLDLVDEDQPSGIVIFGDEENKEETEDGEILEKQCPELRRKMSVGFPGINAPIPENADERRWVAGTSSHDLSRNRSHHRSNHSSEHTSRGYYYEQRSRDYRDDAPPGTEPGLGSYISSYSYRHSDYDSSYSVHSARGSPSLDRSLSDRGRWSPLVHEGSPNHGSYDSPNMLFSPEHHRSGSSGRWDYDNFSSHRMDDRYRYRSRR